MKDFYFTGDDYRYKLETEANRRFLKVLKEKFNSSAQYNGKTWQWGSIILHKAQELSKFLLGKSKFIDFTEPAPILVRSDGLDFRDGILELT
jgi:CRISPR/Cas system-associated endonuclease Cas1